MTLHPLGIVLAALAVLGLVLPSFTQSTPGPTLSTLQAGLLAVMAGFALSCFGLILYLWVAFGGPVPFAISGLDIALWDIAGKRAGLPVYKLLGGSARTQLPAYASLLRYGDAKMVETKTREAISRGYRYIKLHENRMDIIRAAKRACLEKGKNVPLMVDCSCPWTVDEAIAAARELADQNLAWLEEPIYPPDDHSGLARLRKVRRATRARGHRIGIVEQDDERGLRAAQQRTNPSEDGPRHAEREQHGDEATHEQEE